MRKQVDKVNQCDASEDVFERIHTIMHLYRSQQYRALRGTEHELTHMENKVLGYFARHPGATQSDLVAHSGRDKAQLARLIRGLREHGLLDAQADAVDRRSVRLMLTGQGRMVYENLQQRGAELARGALAGMSEEERELLAGLLGRVCANLEVGGADLPSR
jgi:DNA-binding MarR family transcriptional regulator